MAICASLALGCKPQLLATDDPSWDRCPAPGQPSLGASSALPTDTSRHIVLDGPDAFARGEARAVFILDGRYAGATGDRIERLAPESIEHIEVLTGYGAQKRFGVCQGVAVVLITTKAGATK